MDLRMFRKKKKKRPEISAPKNFEHRVHTSFDAKRGCFVGLPTQWQSLIENLRRPRPMVDPSRITEVELRPKKVCHTLILCKKSLNLYPFYPNIYCSLNCFIGSCVTAKGYFQYCRGILLFQTIP
ncbi:hypothetical protein XENORESO_018331 [Xenotaenia resolanae]|uniref:non-specific serine/threonine protein kinase n=1 Tax=Xenotaenia resolanae TaxID=208358 RepID=A0ABV0WMU4_9TELE